MRFEWDEEKNQSNILKHGVSFPHAQMVFLAEDALRRFDRIENGEERWQIIGPAGAAFLLVVYVERERTNGEEVFRIISARRANRTERRDFARGQGYGHR